MTTISEVTRKSMLTAVLRAGDTREIPARSPCEVKLASESAARGPSRRAPGLHAVGYFTSPAAVMVSRLMSHPCPTATSCFSTLVWS